MNTIKENPLLEKSLHFAARIVKLYQHLSKKRKYYFQKIRGIPQGIPLERVEKE